MKIFDISIIKNGAIILFLYIAPVLLILINIIPFQYRFMILITTGLIIIVLAAFNKISKTEAGFNHKSLVPAIKDIIPATVICVFLSILYYKIYGTRVDNSSIPLYFYIFYILVSAPLQEFLYRSYLFYLVSKLGLSQYFWVISPALYALAHTIYNDFPIVIMSFVIGIYWAYHYSRFKNLYSVSLSHIILGIVAITTGIL